ncbi:hypothetical protein BD770DRAFT_295512, partial [Pilaira anomala]
GGHQGRDKSVAKAKENGWWPNMVKEVQDFVAACLSCQKFKAKTHKFVNLTSIKVGGPCKVWAADIAFFPLSNKGNRYLLIFMEYLTKWVVAVPLASLDTDSVANVLLYSIILQFSCP